MMGIHFSDGTFRKRDYAMEIIQIVNNSVRKTSVVSESGEIVSRSFSENDTTKMEAGAEVVLEVKCSEGKEEIGTKPECGYRHIDYSRILENALERVSREGSNWVIGVTSRNTLSMFRNAENIEDPDNFSNLILRFKDEK